jgi:hypothetical protein
MSTPERNHFGVFQIEVGTMEGFPGVRSSWRRSNTPA